MNKKITLNHGNEKKIFFDEQTDKRNHEHLANEQDEITEEDIRHVRTDINEQGNDEGIGSGRFDVDDKLIGDDLELGKAADDSEPEIDQSENALEP